MKKRSSLNFSRKSKLKKHPWRFGFYTFFVFSFLFFNVFPIPVLNSFGFFSLPLKTALAAAPSNDFASNATEITGTFPLLTAPVNISEATNGNNPGNDPAIGGANFTVWYTLTAQPGLVYRVQTCNSLAPANTVPDTLIGVFLGGPAGPWTTIASNDEFCASQSLVTFRNPTNSPQFYWIMVGKFGTTAPATGQTDVQLYIDTLLPPANDYASNALAIPSNGPFPYATQPVTISGASIGNNPASEPTMPSGANFTIWYTFTAATANIYTVQTCNSVAGGTTVADTVLGVYTATNGANGPFSTVASNDNACGLQSLVSFLAVPGTTYWIMVGKNGSTSPLAGQDSLQLYISESTNNDNVNGAQPLTLNIPVAGTNQFATNDYQLPSASPCFSGIGQSATTATGRDTVYSFQAPATNKYSFKVTGYNSFGNLTLYVANSLPTGTPPLTVTDCVKAANRNGFSTNATEEINDVSLAAGQTVYLVVDESFGGSTTTFRVEVTLSTSEIESNDSLATAITPFCMTTGAITPTGDVDFYTLGAPPVNSRVFALVEGYAANAANFDLRVNSQSDTLEYDDDNNDTIFGQNAPNVAGTVLPGGSAYLQVNYNGNATTAEPYRLYSVVQPPLAQATIEAEPNNSIAQANFSATNYFSGTILTGSDSDFYGFAASAGQLVYIGLDADPTRNSTPFNGALELYDQAGTLLLSVNDTSSLTSGTSTVSGAGSLVATSPKAIGEGLVYRFSRAGLYYIKVLSGTSPTPATGDYLLSIAKDCANGFGGLPRLNSVGGNNQITPVNTLFANSLAISVTTPEGAPMPSMRLTFTAPTNGASGTFANSLTSYVTQTDALGVATALPFTANSISGSYLLTATLEGTTASFVFTLTNQGLPAIISATAGNNQAATISTTFSLPLETTVRDSTNNPVAGAVVTFTAPLNGASAVFANGNSTFTTTTNSSGVATATLTANSTVGSYNVLASVAGVANPATFALTNTVGAPATILNISGSEQSSPISTTFAAPLVASVRDAGNNPIAGVVVTFTAPLGGASAIFANGLSAYSVSSDAAGLVTATLSANSVAGSYNVVASAAGVATPATFALTNTVGSPAKIEIVSGSNQTTVISTTFSAPLVVKVSDAGNNPVVGAVVTFTAPLNGASAKFGGGLATYSTQTAANGVATSTLLTANSLVGSYSLTATVAGVVTPALFSLTNTTDCANPFVVTLTSDDGSGTTCGSFSRALKSGGTQISFGFNAKTVISVTGMLPDVPPAIQIDGGCVNGQPQVVLAGSNILTDALRVTFNTVITGVGVVGFGGYALDIQGSNNQISCAWLGTADGTTAWPNAGGIRIGIGTNISGYNVFRSNLISGNSGIGLDINKTFSDTFIGNFIGLQKDGISRLPNSRAIRLISGSNLIFLPGNRIAN